MNLTYFHPKMKICEKTTAQSTSVLLPKYQTSEISLKASDLMLKHQKWQHWLWLNGTRTAKASYFGSAYLKRFVRASKNELLVDKVELVNANPIYARVRCPGDREVTVSLRDLAACSESENVRALFGYCEFASPVSV